MSIISVIVAIVFFILLIKGVFESGIWGIIVLIFIIISLIKDKKKKKRKKTKKNNNQKVKKANYQTSKNNSQILNDFTIDTKKHQNNFNYKNEPINKTEEFINDKKKIAQLRQMKSLTFKKGESNETNKLFYLQATFMDDFIDDYDFNVPCKKYLPTYNDLTMYQLRSYFSWRTLVRSGIYKPTSLTYVYLYIYELLNKIGVKNSIDGLNKLIELWQNYHEFDASIDNYLALWIKDYYIMNQINIDYKLIEEEFPIKITNQATVISEIMLGNYVNKLKFYDYLSSYHILDSKIMEHKYSFLVDMIVPEVFQNLDKYFNEFNLSFNKILFGDIKRSDWQPYRGAIYYDNPLNKDFKMTFNNYEQYYKIKNNYYKETFEYSLSSKPFMGYLLKSIDATLRECLKMPKSLKINISMLNNVQNDTDLYNFLINEKIVLIINNTIKKYLIEHKQEISNIINEKRKQEIVIDENKFASIRESSNRVQEKLIVEEDFIMQPKEEIIEQDLVTTSENIFVDFINNLNLVENDFLKMIIENKPKNFLINICQENNVLYEIMLENINNKALDIIGDNLIEDCDTEVIIYAEYIDAIKNSMGGK